MSSAWKFITSIMIGNHDRKRYNISDINVRYMLYPKICNNAYYMQYILHFFKKKQQKSISRKNRRRTVDSQKSRFFCSDSSQGSLTTVLGRGIVVRWKMASTSSSRPTSPSLLKDSSSTNWPSLPFTKLKSSSNKVLGKGVNDI